MVNNCEIPSRELFAKAVHVHMGDEAITFDTARRTAIERAKTYCADPMLLSWYDRQSGAFSPKGLECCREGKPSWVSYAEERGADLTIDINDEEFIFMFRESEGLFHH